MRRQGFDSPLGLHERPRPHQAPVPCSSAGSCHTCARSGWRQVVRRVLTVAGTHALGPRRRSWNGRDAQRAGVLVADVVGAVVDDRPPQASLVGRVAREQPSPAQTDSRASSVVSSFSQQYAKSPRYDASYPDSRRTRKCTLSGPTGGYTMASDPDGSKPNRRSRAGSPGARRAASDRRPRLGGATWSSTRSRCPVPDERTRRPMARPRVPLDHPSCHEHRAHGPRRRRHQRRPARIPRVRRRQTTYRGR